MFGAGSIGCSELAGRTTALLMPTPTFCGIPRADPAAVDPDVPAAVIGAGTSLGSAHTGSENGPYFIRTLSKQYTWSAKDPFVFNVDHPRPLLAGPVDVGDVAAGDSSLPSYLAALRGLVSGLPLGVAPCVLGGDHSITLAVVQGLQDRGTPTFDVVQFDHHLDLQLWGEVAPCLAGDLEPVFNTNVMSHVSRALQPGGLTQVGVGPYAAVESASWDAVRQYLDRVGPRISVLSPVLHDDDLFRTGIAAGENVYVTIDVDVLQPAEMSSTPYPATVGLSVVQLLKLIDLVLAGRHLVGFDVVEFAAAREDRSRKTLADAARAALIVLRLLSWASRQTAHRTESQPLRTE